MTARVLAILLAVSVGLNMLAGWAYLGQRDKTTVAQTEQRQTVAVATKCSEGTEKLAKAARQREADAKPLRQATADKNREHQANAQRIMSTPPAVPGDACASAQVELDTWWAGRVKP